MEMEKAQRKLRKEQTIFSFPPYQRVIAINSLVSSRLASPRNKIKQDRIRIGI